MKKHITLLSAALLSLGLMTTVALAEDGRGSDQGYNVSGSANAGLYYHNDSQGQNRDDEGEDINEDGVDLDENDLHHKFDQIPQIQTSISLPEASSSITTYSDLVVLLNNYQNALNVVASATPTFASSTLSVNEQQLFQLIMRKDSFELSRSQARIAEIRAEIQSLITALTPLGTQTINTSFGLKGLLLDTTNNIASAIRDVASLQDQTSVIFHEETN